MSASTSLADLAAKTAASGLTRDIVLAVQDTVDRGEADLHTLLTLGHALLAANQLILAEKCYGRARALAPGDVVVQTSLAETFRLLGKSAEARSLFEAVAAGDWPEHIREVARMRAAAALPVITASREQIAADRARLAAALAAVPPQTVADAHAGGGFTNFYLAYHAENDRALQQAAAAYYTALCPSLAFRAPHVNAPAPMAGRRLRIGIVSRHLFDHTIGYLNHGLITGLNREVFELTLFRISSGRLGDDVAAVLAAAADHVCDLPGTLAEARAAIAGRQMDVLHYPDLGMEHLGYFLAFARLAPVQTVGWGHPVTTGIPAIDHFLSVDAMEPEDGAGHYSENLVRLAAPVPSVPPPRMGSGPSDKATFGMDSARPAYLCAQALFKVHPDFDAVAAQLLARDPTGIVYFIGLWDHVNRQFIDRLSKTVGGNMDRLRLLPRAFPHAFPSLLAAADVLLDVPQWSGGRTSLEGFAAGTPIVHWPGKFMRGRHTLAFYKHMDMAGCVVGSAEEYVDTAWRLAHDQAFRASVRNMIKERAPRLFNDTAAVREVEAFWLNSARSKI